MLTDVHSPTWLTIKDVAERLHVHDRTVRAMIRDGRLPAVRLGGPGSAIRIDERELEAFLYADPEKTA
jgi:excisionase family DNA binding protein